MADKKGVILIRFPEDLATTLRRISFELDTPIKDIVSEIVEDNIQAWFAVNALDKFGETHDSLRRIKSILERVPLAAGSNRPETDPIGTIKETKEYLEMTVKFIRQGYVPLDLLVTGTVEPSHEASSQEELAKQLPASRDRQRKKAP